MGYTHYWKIIEPLKVSETQKTLIREVLKEEKKHLAGGMGKGKPEFDDKHIWLNGKEGKEDLSHETFEVKFGETSDFEFCKTARKPYDMAVCKLLLILSLSKGFSFSSDGELADESWPDALKWFTDKGYADTIEKKIRPNAE